MKSAIKTKSVILTAVISFLITFGVNAAIWLVITFALTDIDYNYNYTFGLYILLVLFALIGWVGGNQVINKYRRQEKNWDGEVPESIKISAWKRRWAAFLPALGYVVIIAICEIFYAFAGHYPFMSALA